MFGRQAAFTIDAASFLISAWLIAGIRRPMQEPKTATRDHGSVREALVYIRRNPIVLRLLFAKVGGSSANGIVGLLPTGLLFAARGLGAMIGPILVRGAVGAIPARRVIVVVCGVSTLTYSLVYAVFPLAPVLALAMVLVIFGLFIVLLVENSRIPFDDPNTHLELTMVHEVMVLDHGGPAFGVVLHGAAVKLFVLASLVVRLAVPVLVRVPLSALPGVAA